MDEHEVACNKHKQEAKVYLGCFGLIAIIVICLTILFAGPDITKIVMEGLK